MDKSREIINVAGTLVAVCVFSAFGFALWALVYIKVPLENQNALLIVLGTLTGLVTAIVSFYFGSSSLAKKQADTIDTQATAVNKSMPNKGDKVQLEPGEQVKVEGVPKT